MSNCQMSQTNSNFGKMKIWADILKVSYFILRELKEQEANSLWGPVDWSTIEMNLWISRWKRGLKERIRAIMWKFVNSGCCENDVCSWIIFCDCGNCRNTRKKFWFQQWERIPSTLSKIPNNNSGSMLHICTYIDGVFKPIVLVFVPLNIY